ncbi:hypothetical protein [Winogradskyella sp. UBA3174]|uniref:hypothetical protein n=1 Tax=Winogradskyella sp. UBA3174 TaxID=1947785 RepID=UPI0025DBAC07|nr:hypothetical protein [Winogradskyella sp. UBA3174]|tara:strand:+ start:206 stop:799 length:594 start_codon:yes stop_codon:yes gene_type:complete
MSTYKNDRAFTNYVHNNLALPLIYKKIEWKEVKLKTDYAQFIDMTDGIDYIFRKDDAIMTIQERFREEKYQNYSDFTIRYRRDENKIENRRESEYYKMKAHYFTYGIIDSAKNKVNRDSCFIKFAIIDLKKVYEKLDSKAIFISDNNKNKCEIVDGNRIECPIKYNSDGSSSFFPIDIAFLVKLWGSDMVIFQKGFF